MEYRQIEYFVDTYRHRSITRAAEALFISQQALSKEIRRLEAELGVQLFNRSVRGIAPTQEGTWLYEQFAPKVDAVRSGIAAAEDRFKVKQVELEFCTAPMIMRGLGPDVFLEFEEQHPEIHLSWIELSDADCDRYVEADPHHFGLLAVPETHHGERLPFRHVKTFPLYFACADSNPLADRPEVDFSMLRDQKFVVLEKKSYYRKTLNWAAKQYGYKPKELFESGDPSVLLHLVDQGKGSAICLPFLVNPAVYPHLRLIPFRDKGVNWSVAFIYQDEAQLSPQVRLLMDFVCGKFSD